MLEIISQQSLYLRSCGSSVSLVTRLRAGRQGFTSP